MSEECVSEACCKENACAVEAENPKVKLKKKRDIFRFKGQKEDMAINLEHVYKMVQMGKRITFQVPNADPEKSSADYVDFENEEASLKAFEQILAAWSSDVVE